MNNDRKKNGRSIRSRMKLTKTENTRNIRHKSLEEFMFWLSPSSGCGPAGSLFRKSSRVKFLYNIKTIRNINPD